MALFLVQHPHQEVFIVEHRSMFWKLKIMRRFMKAAVLFMLERR